MISKSVLKIQNILKNIFMYLFFYYLYFLFSFAIFLKLFFFISFSFNINILISKTKTSFFFLKKEFGYTLAQLWDHHNMGSFKITSGCKIKQSTNQNKF